MPQADRSNKRRVAYHTLGCKVNQYDTEAMRACFEQAGYATVPFEGQADIYLINTCTVTGTGDKKSLQLIRRCHRKAPEAQIIVTGCLAQRAPEDLLLPGVCLVLGTQRRASIVPLFEQALQSESPLVAVAPLKGQGFEPLRIEASGHTRATMKIQEGCNRYCTYCIIPSVRGPIRSRPLSEIAQEAKRLSDAGFAEIVLAGIHLTSYGLDLGEGATLLEAIEAAQAPEGIRRVRLGSLEPVVVTPAFVQGLKALPKVCRQFHLALQSGSDAVLARMRRRYTAAEFLNACRLLRDAFPDCSITTDVMTGFPGETEADFDQTFALCQAARFSRMHVFPYSERGGTLAATFPDPVARPVRQARAARLIQLGEEMERAAARAMIGKRVEILVEEAENGLAYGYTDEYLRACVPQARPGEWVLACVTDWDGQNLVCRRMEA